jgi:hypothetical protein
MYRICQWDNILHDCSPFENYSHAIRLPLENSAETAIVEIEESENTVMRENTCVQLRHRTALRVLQV